MKTWEVVILWIWPMGWKMNLGDEDYFLEGRYRFFGGDKHGA
jgi:hypothetical protein